MMACFAALFLTDVRTKTTYRYESFIISYMGPARNTVLDTAVELESLMENQHRSPCQHRTYCAAFSSLFFFSHLPTVASTAHHPSPQASLRGMR